MLRDARQLSDIRWDAQGLVPAIVQDSDTKQVLMMAYMNAESLRQTLVTGETVFWSRSRETYGKGVSKFSEYAKFVLIVTLIRC
jgi:phosphoribosyl-AMP cyclohydrolase